MIVVTGATGQLGRLVIQELLQTTPAEKIIAVVRHPASAQPFASSGIQVRHGDYDRPETLAKAFVGAQRILLISSSEVGRRVPQHRAVIDAAHAAAVDLLAYTSILHAGTSSLMLAEEHRATEQYLLSSGVPFALLRNGWYLENHTAAIPAAIAHGAVVGAAGTGRFAAASRQDYAAAAAAVLTGSGHQGKIYELGGDDPYTLADLAAEISRQSGKPVTYRDLSEADLAQVLMSIGLPEPLAHTLADADLHARDGALTTDSQDLRQLIGRPTTDLASAVQAASSR